MQFILHSYSFRDYPLEAAFESARKFGWDGLELQRAHFNPDYLNEELPRCQRLGQRFGIPIYCVDFSGDFTNDDPDMVSASERLVERSIRICAERGVRLLNGFTGFLAGANPQDYGANGSAIASDTHFERAAQCLRRLGATALDHDVTLTLEIHMNTIHDTIASTVRLLDMVDCPNVLANPDPGNMYATSTAERDPGALDLLAGRIGYFHLKNCVELDGGCDFSVCLEDGAIDTKSYLRKLAGIGYNGPICVEYCGTGDPHPSVERDIAFLRGAVEEIAEFESR